MTQSVRRLLARCAVVTGGTALALGALGAGAGAASAQDPEPTPQFLIFVVKDQAGGAYWLATTTAIRTMTETAETGEKALLTVNAKAVKRVEALLP